MISKAHSNPFILLQNRNTPLTSHRAKHPSLVPLDSPPSSPILDGQAHKSLPVLQQQGEGSWTGIQSLLCPTNNDGQQVPTLWLLQHIGCTLLVRGDEAWRTERN